MIITNFSAGELSSTLNGRTDIQQYFQGTSLLKNFDVIPTGGLERRKGTERLSELEGNGRLIPFIIDSDTSFILEMRSHAESNKTTIYVWKNGEKMIDTQGLQVSFEGPWASLDEIREIQYAQNYNVMIFVQKNHAPFMVTYNEGLANFTYGEMTFDFTPKVELDDDYGYIDVVTELPAVKNRSGYVIYDGYLYIWKDTQYVLDESTTEFIIDKDLFTTEGKYPGAVAFYNGRLFLGATKKDQQKVWASGAPDLEGTHYQDFSTYIKYVTVNKVLKDPDIHFFTADATTDSSTLLNVTQDLTKVADLNTYYVTGNNIEEGTQAVEASWDPVTEKGTLMLSRPVTKAVQQQIYSIQKWVNRLEASSDDYEYKVINRNMTSPENGFYFEIASDQNDGIKWLSNASYLIIGTESATYVMSPQSNANVQQVVMNGRYGTDNIQATVVDNAVIYFAQGKRGIREYYFNQDVNSFRSNNLALLAPQMLMESPAVDFDFMTNPYSRLLITRADGTMAILLYDKNIGVQAWSRLELQKGKIQSVAVVRGNAGCDIVYMIVKYDENYYMEKLDLDSKVYLDSWKQFSSIDVVDYPGGVLYNRTQDRTCEDPENIPDDFIAEGDDVIIGYEYDSIVKSMPILKNDVTAKKRIVKLICRFYNSYRPELQVDKKIEKFTNFTAPYSGLKEIDYPGESKRDVYFTLRINEPYECNILAINALVV